MRELERFFDEKEKTYTASKGQRVKDFCDLERVMVNKHTKLADGTTLVPGTCVWTLPATRNSMNI
jgi:hypothetical protein